MMSRPAFRFLAAALLLGASALPAFAQQGRRIPRVGYLYPAGVQRGTSCEVTAGGQFLDGVTQAFVSGSGVTITLVRYEKPLPGKRMTELRDYIQDARKKAMDAVAQGTQLAKPFDQRRFDRVDNISIVLKEAGATDDEIREFVKKRRQDRDPKRQQNQQISETAVFKIDVAPDAAPGPREMRLLTPLGLTNPMAFCVGTFVEGYKDAAEGKKADAVQTIVIPSVFNGQILPGETDRVAFQARRGARLVAAVQARDLIPYLADAVPGWFQPVLRLTDANGREVAYSNAFRYSPDPVLSCEIPADGQYRLEIRDALYRGREDFVYRVTVGEIPFITGIYPLGVRTGAAAALDVTGWNIARKRIILPPQAGEGIRRVADLSNGTVISDPALDATTLPEIEEKEPNNAAQSAQAVALPAVVNGRIGVPGGEDVFAVSCEAGREIVAEVVARRLGSPLDSWLKITDALGTQVAFNDDRDDKGAALLTHQADSLIRFTPTAQGTYYIHLGDAQKRGGPEYAYRLRLSPPRPDFALRWAPSCINAPRPGVTLPFTVYALRRDGFEGEIRLAFKDAPPGFVLEGGCIPAGQDQARVTVTFPTEPTPAPVPIPVEGRAIVAGREVVHPAVPADDMLQAFAYHHLVPAQSLVAYVSGSGRGGGALGTLKTEGVATLAPGGTAKVILASVARRLASGTNERIQLQLSEPPEGIRIESVVPEGDGIAVILRAEASVAPGLRGNLIAEAFREQTYFPTPPPAPTPSPPAQPTPAVQPSPSAAPTAQPSATATPTPTPEPRKQQKRRWSIGFLPAIPFEVVKPAP